MHYVISDDIQPQHTSFIDFTAWKKSTQNYIIGDTIVFDGVMFNEGGHYEVEANRFEIINYTVEI